MKKVLSVVVPSYNIEHYIEQCLKSFLNLDILNDIEVLIIDDGSKDKTGEIGKSYASHYPEIFRYIYKKNGGHGSAINKGLQCSVGKYFMVVDGDDWVKTKELKKLVNYLKDIDSDLVAMDYVRVSESVKQRISCNAPQYNIEYQFSELDVGKYYFVMSAICYKTEILKRIHLRLPENMYYVDLIYIIKPMNSVKTVIFFNIAPYQYRIGDESQSISAVNMAKNYEQHKDVVLELLNFYETCEPNLKQTAYIRATIIRAILDNYYILLEYIPTIQDARKKLISMDSFLFNHSYKEFYYSLPKKIKILRIGKYCILGVYRKIKRKRKYENFCG